MATTAAPLSLPYPTGGDQPNGPTQIAALAARIQLILANDTSNAPALRSGLTGGVNCRRIGALVTISWAVTKPTATTNADVVLTTIASTYRPEGDLTGPAACGAAIPMRYYITAANGYLTMRNVNYGTSLFFCGVCTFITTLPSS